MVSLAFQDSLLTLLYRSSMDQPLALDEFAVAPCMHLRGLGNVFQSTSDPLVSKNRTPAGRSEARSHTCHHQPIDP